MLLRRKGLRKSLNQLMALSRGAGRFAAQNSGGVGELLQRFESRERVEAPETP